MRQFSALLFVGMLASACNGQHHTPATSPKLVKNHFTTELRLPYWGVNSGLLARSGDLWFITSGEGVYRYDGKVFTNYTTADALANNSVCSILEDANGNMWFGTRDGACRFDGDSFVNFPIFPTEHTDETPEDTYPRPNQVWSMMQDKTGKIWFGTSQDVYTYDGSTFSRFLDDKTIRNDSNLHLRMVHTMLQDKTGDIWFGSGFTEDEGACRFDGKSITSIHPNGANWIRSIAEDKAGTLYFTTRNKGLLRKDGDRFTNISAPGGIRDGDLYASFIDRSGTIWIPTEGGSGQIGEPGGLWRFDGKTYTHFTTKDGLPHNGVFCAVEDKAGNIWIGTRNTGLCRYDGKEFVTFSE